MNNNNINYFELTAKVLGGLAAAGLAIFGISKIFDYCSNSGGLDNGNSMNNPNQFNGGYQQYDNPDMSSMMYPGQMPNNQSCPPMNPNMPAQQPPIPMQENFETQQGQDNGSGWGSAGSFNVGQNQFFVEQPKWKVPKEGPILVFKYKVDYTPGMPYEVPLLAPLPLSEEVIQGYHETLKEIDRAIGISNDQILENEREEARIRRNLVRDGMMKGTITPGDPEYDTSLFQKDHRPLSQRVLSEVDWEDERAMMALVKYIKNYTAFRYDSIEDFEYYRDNYEMLYKHHLKKVIKFVEDNAPVNITGQFGPKDQLARYISPQIFYLFLKAYKCAHHVHPGHLAAVGEYLPPFIQDEMEFMRKDYEQQKIYRPEFYYDYGYGQPPLPDFVVEQLENVAGNPLNPGPVLDKIPERPEVVAQRQQEMYQAQQAEMMQQFPQNPDQINMMQQQFNQQFGGPQQQQYYGPGQQQGYYQNPQYPQYPQQFGGQQQPHTPNFAEKVDRGLRQAQHVVSGLVNILGGLSNVAQSVNQVFCRRNFDTLPTPIPTHTTSNAYGFGGTAYNPYAQQQGVDWEGIPYGTPIPCGGPNGGFYIRRSDSVIDIY